MFLVTVMMALRASMSEVPEETPASMDAVDTWRCRNQVEVWCAADGCAASAPGEFTPMDITARADGPLSVCAYTGCWEGEASVANASGRLLWTADALPFTTRPGGEGGAVTLLITAKDGVGFVRVGGLATPLLCGRQPQKPPEITSK